MKFDLLFAIVLCLLQSFGAYCFNIDIGKAVVFDGVNDGSSKSEYFGYSVALHSFQSQYWVIVGAPLSNVTSSSSSETLIRYGAAYRCEYTGRRQCNIINIDNQPPWTEYVTFNNVSNTLINMEEKSGMWLGGVVYSTGRNGKALVCAPRYIFRGRPVYDESIDKQLQKRWLWGQCRLLDASLTRVDKTLDPCSYENSANIYYGYCEAGISAEYTIDGLDVVMGAVGAKRGRGVLMLQTEPRSSQSKRTDKSVVDQLTYDGYMGYSVSSGYFTDKRRPEFVGGAPRGDGIKGKAIIYGDSGNHLSVKVVLPQPKNLPTGTYFGSALCAVDLDNNKFTDILIGAPYFTHVKDEGRVYIYLNNGQGALNLQDSFLEGDKKVNAHFGQAIASVGDLNADSFQDVAIGAPFEGEDDSGAVYIYHGSSKGIELQYRQKIIGSQVKSGLRMFGISISGGVDVDQNRYPDIAVGAYGSENAVILRSRSIVNVEGRITLSKQQITLEGNDSLCDVEGTKYKCVNITLAFKYDDVIAATATQDFNITYTVELDKDKGQPVLRRMFFLDEVNKERTVALKKPYIIAAKNTFYSLLPRTVYIKDKNDIGDVTSLLSFDLTVSLPPPPCTDLCPVLNDYLPSTFRAEIPFKKKCKNEVACVPDLALSGSLVFSPAAKVKDALRIGVVRDFTVQLTVENKAVDYAYTSKIKLMHPDNLDYIGPDEGVECDRSTPDNGTITVTCGVGNPLKGKSSKSFGIKFKPGTVRENFDLQVEAFSQDTDFNNKDNKIEFSVTVKFEADVEITGSSKQDRVVYAGPVRDKKEVMKNLESIGPEVIQTVSVRNKGPSAVDGSVVTVYYPNLYSSSKPESYLLYLLHIELKGGAGSCDAKVNPLDIKASNNTYQSKNQQSRKRRDTEENSLLGCRQVNCKYFQCSLGLLKMGDKVEIKMTFRLWENTLLKELDTPKAVDLETFAKVKVPDIFTQTNKENDETTIITTANPTQTAAQEKKTPWWVIFLSILGGVLLLGGAIAVLYKLGFFKRKRAKDISDPMEESVPMNAM